MIKHWYITRDERFFHHHVGFHYYLCKPKYRMDESKRATDKKDINCKNCLNKLNTSGLKR